MKKFLAIFLAMVMVFSLAACGDSDSDDTATSGSADSSTEQQAGGETEDEYADVDKTVVVGISADPQTFYPWGSFSQGSRHIFPMIYQTLLSDVRDPDTGDVTYYHALMESYEQTDDTHNTVKIYEEIYDTAGNHFTASDVVYCWTMFQSESPAASNISGLLAYEAVDEYTVECTVSEDLGVGDFEDILTTVNMVTQAAYEASEDGMATDPVGTTGYVLEEYVSGSYVVVTKSDNEYWNQDANDSKDVDAGYIPTSNTNNVDTVRFEIITDTNTMALALETGDIDIATSVSTTDVAAYKEDDEYLVHEYPDNMYGVIFNASESSVFNNINLRKAVAYSISKEDLLNTIYDGDGWALTAFAMDYQIGYVDDWDDREYFDQDMDLAQEYLEAYYEETGTTAADLSINLITMSTDAMSKYAQVVQAALIELTGNEDVCTITTYDSATYSTMRNDPENFDLAILNSMSNKAYVIYNWSQNYNGYDRTTGDDVSFSGDTELWDLCIALQNDLNDETATAFQDYLDEQCYFVNYICGPAYWVGSELVETWVLGAKNSVAVCAMEFDWSQR